MFITVLTICNEKKQSTPPAAVRDKGRKKKKKNEKLTFSPSFIPQRLYGEIFGCSLKARKKKQKKNVRGRKEQGQQME